MLSSVQRLAPAQLQAMNELEDLEEQFVPPPCLTDHAIMQRLRRIFKRRANGEYIQEITQELVDMFQDAECGRDKIKAMFEKAAYNPDPGSQRKRYLPWDLRPEFNPKTTKHQKQQLRIHIDIAVYKLHIRSHICCMIMVTARKILPRVKAKIDASVTALETVTMEILELQGLGLLDGYSRKCLFFTDIFVHVQNVYFVWECGFLLK